MIIKERRCLYSVEEPEGIIFEEGDEVSGEWFDTPDFNRKEKPEKADTEESLEVKIVLENLKTQYMEKFHKKPHHLMKAEGILKAINNDSEHDNNGSTA